jgi:2-iminobutanoate/2-iminopropanoate deaminase
MKITQTSQAPKAVGPYSQAVEAGGFVFCSGQIGIDPSSGTIVQGIRAQITQVMENLTQVIIASGSDMNHVLKTTIYLVNLEDYAEVNELYGRYFPTVKPARATVGVNRLPKDVLIEIDAVAQKI